MYTYINSMIYYIYHIPERNKIGVTKDLKDRMSRHKWTGAYEILEEHTDIYEVSNREIQLQKDYGYVRDNPLPYHMTIQAGLKGALVGGYANKGIPKPHAAAYAKALNTKWYCEVCNKPGKGKGNWTRYHKNCK